MDEAADDAACVRCGAQVEIGYVTASAGQFGLARWPKLGWLTGRPKGWRRFLYGEVIRDAGFGPLRVPAYRCTACWLVFFEW
jgi:hypothetical protein